MSSKLGMRTEIVVFGHYGPLSVPSCRLYQQGQFVCSRRWPKMRKYRVRTLAYELCEDVYVDVLKA